MTALNAKIGSNVRSRESGRKTPDVFSEFFTSLMKNADREAYSVGVLMTRIAGVTGRTKRLVAGAAILSHSIARFMAGKAGLTTGKTRVASRKNALT